MTTPQNVAFSDSTVGFTLPTYTSAQSACSVSTLEVSTSGSSLVTTTDLALSGSLVKPSNTALHQAYSFYIKATNIGGSFAFFGPYVLNVGCFSGVATYSDNGSFVTSVAKSVGDAIANAYTFNFATSNLAYCTTL